MKRISLWFLAAFILRVAVSPLYYHQDADTYYYWGKYLWEKRDFLFFLGKAVPNAMPATYPPIFYYLLFLWRGFYEFVGSLIWFLNVKIPIFPSGLIPWYQSYNFGVAFNKIPAIIADIGLGLLIYKIGGKIGNKKFAGLAAVLFLLLPAGWYNSAYWGQIESLYSFFVVLSFFLILKEKYLWSVVTFGCSLLIKPTGLFVLPALLIYFINKKKLVDFIVGGIAGLLLAWILYFPFQPVNTLPWAADFYLKSFSGEINFLTANAFNFWALIFGFKEKITVLFLGFPAKYWGWGIFVIGLLAICYKQWHDRQKSSIFISAFLLAFSAFLFLPLMHERYFYTTLIFAAIVGSLSKKYLYLFVALSVIHFLNLYHFWWQPGIPFLITLLSNLAVVRGIILLSGYIFFMYLINFFKKWTSR